MSVHMLLLEQLKKQKYAVEKSPCISDCTLVNKSTYMICKGCGRTQEEITGWGMFTKIEIDKILNRLNKTLDKPLESLV
jgi:predicted Fe-S protein YdhL (DUF1289 family)|tara:strand:- start:283 stop:519 length:237 start_codon:yes stop_codon:yes gene_type:complete